MRNRKWQPTGATVIKIKKISYKNYMLEFLAKINQMVTSVTEWAKKKQVYRGASLLKNKAKAFSRRMIGNIINWLNSQRICPRSLVQSS